jgi:hypothetical protein
MRHLKAIKKLNQIISRADFHKSLESRRDLNLKPQTSVIEIHIVLAMKA